MYVCIYLGVINCASVSTPFQGQFGSHFALVFDVHIHTDIYVVCLYAHTYE